VIPKQREPTGSDDLCFSVALSRTPVKAARPRG